MIAEGVNGYMEVRGGALLIRRKLFYGKSKGEKTIPLQSITSVQFRNAGILSGFLQVAYSGSQESKKGIWEATNDENTIMFSRAQQPQFEKIRAHIENARQTAAEGGGDVTARLIALAQLHRDGQLSDAEFAAAKERLLGG